MPLADYVRIRDITLGLAVYASAVLSACDIGCETHHLYLLQSILPPTAQGHDTTRRDAGRGPKATPVPWLYHHHHHRARSSTKYYCTGGTHGKTSGDGRRRPTDRSMPVELLGFCVGLRNSLVLV